ncbi:hypothetical protein ACOJUR_08395 [Alicyclobacillus tolerans]|uniref:hypothetical protein n=1 Tax=Alicyclobacillus tolerans TaxID=90970 RepID=UPI003B7BC01E
MLLTRLFQELQHQPYEAVFITGNPQEIYLATSLGVATILYTKEGTDYTHMPDHEAHDISSLLKSLNGEMYGYFGELFAHGISGTGRFKEFEIEHLLSPDTKATLFVGGRYFTSNYRRTYIHPLSHRILGLKNGWTSYIQHMGDLLARTIKVYMHWGEHLNCRPTQARTTKQAYTSSGRRYCASKRGLLTSHEGTTGSFAHCSGL